MAQSNLPFPDLQIEPAGRFDEPEIWVRRLVFVTSPVAPIQVIRRIAFRRGLNIVCTEPRLPVDTQPVGHSVGKSLLVRIIRYCLGEDRFCTDTQRAGIALKHERGYVFAVIRVGGEDWAVARPLGLESGYADSWCVRSSRLKGLVPKDDRLKFREFVEALNAATRDCYAEIDLPNAERRANWRDLLGWLSRDQDCYFAHHAEWRAAELLAGPRALTREDAYLVMRMALGLLGPEEIGLIDKHRKLLAGKADAEAKARQYAAYVEQAENRLRATMDELRDLPAGEVFGAAFISIADGKAKSLNDLLQDPQVLNRQELAEHQDALTKALRSEGAFQATLDGLETKEQVTEAELQNAKSQDAPTLLRVLTGSLWKCSYFRFKEEAMDAGCPGKTMVEQGIADPWRTQRIKDLTEELAVIERQREVARSSLQQATESSALARKQLSEATTEFVRVRDNITRQVGQWMARKDEAERYTAAWRDLNDIENGRDARQRRVAKSAEALQGARNRFEKQKGLLSDFYDAVLKQIISPRAEGMIQVDGDGMRPSSNAIVADSGMTLRQYADVLSLDLACLAASVCGVGHLPRFWIHDSPRQADSEEQLYHSIIGWISRLEESYTDNKLPSFQYILTTTSQPPKDVNRWPFVRARLHARRDDGKLLRCDFGK